MSEQKKQGSIIDTDIDLYTITKDVLANWWIIIVLSVSVALFSYVQVNQSYRPVYMIETTYAVTAKGLNNTIYDNLSKAQNMATCFTQILGSETLQNKIAEDLGTPYVPGTITAEVVQETNLVSLKVTSDSPERAYRIMKSLMENYPDISEHLMGSAVLELLTEPVIPTKPINPLDVYSSVLKATLLAAIAVCAGLAVISYLKDTIRRSSDVKKKLDTNLLGTVCHEEKNKTLLSRFRKNKSALLITSPTVSFHYTEMIQKLCRKITNRMEKKGAKTLLVTSYLENEGKSTVAANIALSLVRSGKKVLLIDLDLRKPSQHKMFDQTGEERKELGQVLRGHDEALGKLVRQLDNGLYVILNTKEFGRSTEMLTSGNLEKVLDMAKAEFECVIVDTPPMSCVADTEVIANMVDASLVVVREHISSAKHINDMLDILANCNAEVIGCVFNDAHASVGNAFMGYGYGYGYGYGRYGYGRYGYGNYYGKPENGAQ